MSKSMETKYRASITDQLELAQYIMGYMDAGKTKKEAIQKLAELGWCGTDILKIMRKAK